MPIRAPNKGNLSSKHRHTPCLLYTSNVAEVSFDLPKIIARKSKVVRKLVLGVKAKLTSNNVAMVTGEAQIIDKNTVRCGEETYNAENLILCTCLLYTSYLY